MWVIRVQQSIIEPFRQSALGYTVAIAEGLGKELSRFLYLVFPSMAVWCIVFGELLAVDNNVLDKVVVCIHSCHVSPKILEPDRLGPCLNSALFCDWTLGRRNMNRRFSSEILRNKSLASLTPQSRPASGSRFDLNRVVRARSYILLTA